MSILIKGMEMPTSCWDCEVGGAKQMDNATCPFYSMEYWEQENYQDKIADGCPLVPVPPHGDLIDKSDLMKLFQDEERYGYIDALDIVALPTIIPAELPVHHGTFAAASEKEALERIIPAEEEKTKESLCLNCQSKTCWNEGFDTGVHNCKAYSPYQSDTNYSRIRSLSIYEMADELQVLIDEAVWSGEGKSNNELLEWLQSPAEEGEK